MKFITPLALSATALAAVIPQQAPLGPSIVQNSQQTKWLIELAPYQTRWVTEEEKWALKLVSLKTSRALSSREDCLFAAWRAYRLTNATL